MNFDPTNRLLYLSVAGSYSYGTNTENSDLDLKGILIAPLSYYLGFSNRFEQLTGNSNMTQFRKYLTGKINWSDDKPIDGTVYDIQKFFKLASGCNPNVLESLFIQPEHKLFDYGNWISGDKEQFLSNELYYTIRGFCRSIEKKPKPDSKDQAHLIRLLNMGSECFRSGTLQVYNKEQTQKLLSIRHQQISTEEYNDLLRESKERFESTFIKSVLPNKPNYDYLNKLCQDIIQNFNPCELKSNET